MRILLVGKRKQSISWASVYLRDHYKLKRLRMLDGVGRIIKLMYGPSLQYKDHSWEKRFNVYNALYRIDHEIWVNYLLERRLRKLPRDVIVDDPHYVNEVSKLVEAGFIVVRIHVDNDKKPMIGRSLLDSEPGSVLLNEYYAHMSAYKVDYQINAHDRRSLNQSLDELMLKLLADPKYNIPEGSQESINNSEDIYEKEVSTLNKSIDRGS